MSRQKSMPFSKKPANSLPTHSVLKSILMTTLALLISSNSLAQTSTELPGKAIVDKNCNICHQVAQHAARGYTPEGWDTVLKMMTNQGLNISDEEKELAKAYLIQTFPEKERPKAVIVDGPVQVKFQTWHLPIAGSRPHDPLGARDGSIWYTAQMANMIGRIDPKTSSIRQYPLKKPHSGPHGLMEDQEGNIWYTANTGAQIGKLNPKTGENTEFPMPDATVTDPHSLAIDAKGDIWFTAQVSNRVGRVNHKTGKVTLITPPSNNSRPYGIMVDSKGMIDYVAFGTNVIGQVNPKTLEIKEFRLPNPNSRPRRLVVAPDNSIWYADHSRGYLGHLDVTSGEVTEVPSPGGEKSAPYGMTWIDGAIWYSESGTNPGTVVRFDPQSKKFQTWAIPGGGNIVRNTSKTKDGDFIISSSLMNEITLVKIQH